MTTLASESCQTCSAESDSVDRSEYSELLAQLPGWTIVDEDGAPQLRKSFPFPNFDEALDFANAVGDLAEGANHHPAILIEWGKTTISWWTHVIGGLHRNDFVMAAKTDFLHNK